MIVLRISGEKAKEAFANEAGGHRWQRVPPTERRGRTQTSTITVAVLPEVQESQLKISESDLEITTCRSTGKGGQHVNKTESAVQIKHIPSGLMVRSENSRSQPQNKATAMSILRARLWDAEQKKAAREREKDRRNQVGSGMRGDKRRTIRCQDGIVNDHVTGKQWSYKDYTRGNW